jgi:hypothetical protein
MTEYSCSNCELTSDNKANIERHIHQIEKKCWTDTVPDINKKVNKISCKLCKKKFKTKIGLDNHEKNTCKKVKKDTVSPDPPVCNTINNITNNTTNNITNNTINVTNNNYNIIVPYNDPIMYNEEYIKYSIQRTFMSIVTMISKTHLNPKKTKFHNIHVTNHRNNTAFVYKIGGWKRTKKDELYAELIDKYKSQIDDYIEAHPDCGKDYNVKMKEIIDRDFLTDGEYDEKKFIKFMSEEINNMFMDNRDLVKDTRAKHKKALLALENSKPTGSSIVAAVS